MLKALRAGASAAGLAAATGVDPWFVDQLVLIKDLAATISAAPDAGRAAAAGGQGGRLFRLADR